MLWICNITFVLKGAEAQNPRTLFSAKKKHKGSKTPHANSYCGEEAEQQCWSLKSPAEGTAQRVELPDVSHPGDVTEPELIPEVPSAQKWLRPRH